MRLGFTLIELLITIILFSLLLATSLYSFRFVSINIRKINNTNPQMAMTYNLLRDTISSIYPYIHTDVNIKNPSKRFYFYFYGNNNRCRFISTSGISFKGINLIELEIKDNKLFYKEGNVFGEKIDYRYLDKIILDDNLTLLVGIEKAKFSYIDSKKMKLDNMESIPDFINLKFTKDKRIFTYKFKIKAHNQLRLEKIIARHLEGY